MSNVLRELDRGPCALPPGTVVTLLNMHEERAIMQPLQSCHGGLPRNLRLQHVRGNPMQRSELDQVQAAGAARMRLGVPLGAVPVAAALHSCHSTPVAGCATNACRGKVTCQSLCAYCKPSRVFSHSSAAGAQALQRRPLGLCAAACSSGSARATVACW